MRFDVPVAYLDLAEVEKTPQELVGIQFDESWRNRVLFSVPADDRVNGVREVVHHHIEILAIPFLGEEGVFHLDHVRVVQHLENVLFPVLVLLVLEYLLDSDHLESGLVPSFVDHSESSTPNFLIKCVLLGPFQLFDHEAFSLC